MWGDKQRVAVHQMKMNNDHFILWSNAERDSIKAARLEFGHASDRDVKRTVCRAQNWAAALPTSCIQHRIISRMLCWRQGEGKPGLLRVGRAD